MSLEKTLFMADVVVIEVSVYISLIASTSASSKTHGSCPIHFVSQLHEDPIHGGSSLSRPEGHGFHMGSCQNSGPHFGSPKY